MRAGASRIFRVKLFLGLLDCFASFLDISIRPESHAYAADLRELRRRDLTLLHGSLKVYPVHSEFLGRSGR